jgi:diguanylate cyclase (GGDEF)-like protein
MLEVTARHCRSQFSGVLRLTDTQARLLAGHGISHHAGTLLPRSLLPSERRSVWIADSRRVPELSAAPWVGGALGVRYCAAVPIPGQAGLILFVADRQPRGSCTQADLRDLRTCALMAGPLLTRLDPSADRQAELSTHAEHLQRELAVSAAALGVHALAELELTPLELMTEAMRLAGEGGNLDWCGVLALRGQQAQLLDRWHLPDAAAYAGLTQPQPQTEPETQPQLTLARAEHGWLWQAAQQSGPVVHDHLALRQHLPEVFGTAQGLMTVALGPQGDTHYVLVGLQLTQRGGWQARDQLLLRTVAQVVSQTLDRQSRARQLTAQHAELTYTLDHAPLILWRTDAQGVFQSGQGQGLGQLGISGEALRGLNALQVYRDSPGVVASLHRGLAGEAHLGQASVAGREYETHYQPLRDEQGVQTGLLGLSYDVTQRMVAERRASALLQMVQLMDATAELPAVATQVLQALSGALPMDWLVLWQRDGEVLRPLAVLGEVTPEVSRMQQYGIPLAWIDRYGVLSGVPAYARGEQLPSVLTAAGVQSGALLPVWLDDPAQAVLLGAFCRHDHACSAVQREMLELAAQTLRLAVTRQRQVQVLQSQAFRDPLTGLGNRRALEMDLAAHLQAHSEQDHGQDQPAQLSVLTLDLDHFKAVNDRQGHAAGDELLVLLGSTLQAALRSADRLYRLGGDEFIVLLPRCLPEIPPLAERLKEVERALQTAGFVEVGLSWGHASTQQDGHTAAVLLQRSDERLYIHKRSKAGGAAHPEAAPALST